MASTVVCNSAAARPIRSDKSAIFRCSRWLSLELQGTKPF